MEKTLKLLSDRHSDDLLARHFQSVKKLVSAHKHGFLLKDVITLTDILKRCTGKIETSSKYEDMICLLVHRLSIPMLMENSSDEKFKHDYTLLNLRYISRIEENESQFIDVDKILLSSKMTKTDDSSSNTSKSYTSMIEDGIQPPVNMDIEKMTSKLSTRKSEKQSRARLTDLGVTNDAIHLKNFIEKTLGSHENTIHWDQVTGNIIIFDEIQISGPSYDKNSCRFLDGVMNANPQTKKHVDKLIEKFYSDKGKRQKL